INRIYDKSFNTAKHSMLIEAKSIPFALSVSEEEFLAYLFAKKGYPLLPDIEMNFKDENGALDETALMEFYQERESEQYPDWIVTKNELKRSVSEEKLIQLLNIGINESNTEVILEQLRKSNLHQFRCIVFPRSVYDSMSLSYSEKDIVHYFNAHKSEGFYEYPSVRKVHLLKVPISPSKADSMVFLKTFSELKKPFEKTDNDSLFVETHSDFKVFFSKYKLTYFPESYKGETFGLTFPDALTDEFAAAKKGDIIGPYMHQGSYKMAKVVGFNEQALTVRHILISSRYPMDTAYHEAKRKLANQLLSKINHDNFEEYVVNYSEDPGSIDNGGVYADFMDFEMVEPFAHYAATARIGKIGIVETDFGFHIMEVLDRKKVKFPKLITIQQKLVPSDKVKLEISKQVNELYESIKLNLERLSATEKLNYFDSIGMSYNGVSLNIIHDTYPTIRDKMSENAANQLLKSCFNPAQKPGELLMPINDDTTWIVPFFENAYSSENYNYNQVFGLLKNEFIGSTKSDLIQAKYATVKTLQDLEAAAHLPIITKTIRKDSLDFSDGFLVEFYNFLLSNTPTSNEMQWFKSTRSYVAYEYVSSRIDESVVDLFELKKGLQSKLEEKANLLEFKSYTKPTIYNYPLFILGVRK
ncbi:MAG: peptidylprolyl isomerase, partial [Fluviicola sp.]|nr:peptidylprolyl isomerase [Fluviicola sp.]